MQRTQHTHTHRDTHTLHVGTELMTLGIDSLDWTELLAQVDKTFGIKTMPTLVLEVDTVDQLVDKLHAMVHQHTHTRAHTQGNKQPTILCTYTHAHSQH